MRAAQLAQARIEHRKTGDAKERGKQFERKARGSKHQNGKAGGVDEHRLGTAVLVIVKRQEAVAQRLEGVQAVCGCIRVQTRRVRVEQIQLHERRKQQEQRHGCKRNRRAAKCEFAEHEKPDSNLQKHRQKLGQPMPLFYPNASTLSLGNRGHTTFSIALASVEGTYLSGMGFISLGQVVTEIAVAQSEEYFIRKLPAQDQIKVAAIEHFASKGVRYYDLAGIASLPASEKETNIRRYKLKFSNQIRTFAKTGRQAFKPLLFWPSLSIKKAKTLIQINALSVL